jgi:NitT/TauT family transport system substrate-binding protein
MRIIYAFVLSLGMMMGLFYGVYSFDRIHKIHRHVDRVVLYLQWFNQAQFAGFYVANNKGFYDDEDLEVEIRARPLGGKAVDWNVPDMVSKANDRDDQPRAFGVWTGDQVLRQYAKDKLQIAAVGTVFNRSLACFMVPDKSDIFGPKDFGGKNVGVYEGYDTEILFNWLVNKYPPPSPVNKIFVDPSSDFLSLLNTHQIDVWPAYAINEPLLAEAKNLKMRLIYPDYYDIGYYSDTVIVNRATLTSHRDVVQRFLEASERGWRYALENQKEAIDIVVSYDTSRLRPLIEQQRRMLHKMAFYVSTTNPMLAMDEHTWKSMSDILSDQNALDDVHAYVGLVDFSVAEQGHQNYHRETVTH